MTDGDIITSCVIMAGITLAMIDTTQVSLIVISECLLQKIQLSLMVFASIVIEPSFSVHQQSSPTNLFKLHECIEKKKIQFCYTDSI